MKTKNVSLLALVGLLTISIIAIILAGCASSGTKATSASADKPASSPTVASAKGAVQLWSENCARCHNIRSPNSYSDAQWDVVMLHMRVRANLTADEHKKILAFLKSAH